MIFTEDEQRALARRLNPQLRRCAAEILGDTATATDIDDVAQEGWVGLWRALRDFEGEVADVWCRVVARNAMRTYLQHWRYAMRDLRRVDPVGAAGEICRLVPDAEQYSLRHGVPLSQVEEIVNGSGHLELVDRGYHHGELVRTINALPPGYREYVIKRFWQGYTTTELQRNMSPSVWTRVKPRLAAELSDLVDSVPA